MLCPLFDAIGQVTPNIIGSVVVHKRPSCDRNLRKDGRFSVFFSAFHMIHVINWCVAPVIDDQ